MLNGTPEQVIAAVTANMAAGGPRCISMAGCEIPDGTPHVNLRAQAAALRGFSRVAAPGISAISGA
jgi:uroporphyrinogen-III decarboxylase